jgi:hypothetical protein
MDMRRHWRRLIAPWSGPGEAEETAPSEREVHQRRLGRMLKEGLPVWSELPPHCDGCGRQLLIGERATIVRSGDDLVLTCPLCEERMARAGQHVLRAPAAAESDGLEEDVRAA